MNYFLYRHIRLDKNIPFYIGIGRTSQNGPYVRAYVTTRRNRLWTSIFNKTKIEVEILMESNDISFIKEKEIEFIKMYGRIDIKTGILTNMTDGGDIPYNVSEERKLQISIQRTGTKHTEEYKEKMRKIMTGRINTWGYKNKGRSNPHTAKEIEAITNFQRANKRFGKDHHCSKTVLQFTKKNKLIRVWGSASEILQYLKIGHTHECCKLRLKTAGGFIWRYLNDFTISPDKDFIE